MKRFLFLPLFVIALMLMLTPLAAAQNFDDYEIVYTNYNIYGVDNGPSDTALLKPDADIMVQAANTYHWNYGQGKAPGSISIYMENGTLVGAWKATGRSGQGNTPNAYWDIFPNVVLKQGISYYFVDSDNATWSCNTDSNNCGFIELRGYKTANAPAPAPAASTNISSSYSWAGEWDCGQWGDMVLTQTGNKVTGTYGYDNGRISGTISGNKLTGTWSEAPSYAPPSDAGDIVFEMSADGKSFSGQWRYGSSGSWSDWNGTRTSAVPTVSTPVSKPAATTTTSTPAVSKPTATPITSSSSTGAFSWAGEWDCGQWGDMVLTQTGNKVTGTYGYDNGRISGTISGNKLTGTWSEAPSYAPPSDAGDIVFEMSADGKSFSGQWRYGSSGSWSDWNGTRTSAPPAVSAPVSKPAATTTTSTPATTSSASSSTSAKASAEAFPSGAKLSWGKVNNALGYRVFRSESSSKLGISVTDFYITSLSFADVNVEPKTTYYYTIKPVLAEAKPFQDIDEKLGDTIGNFKVTTGSESYKPGELKHFVLLKLDDPIMSVDGIQSEVDPGRGTTPIIVSNRTMVPIRAIVEAMDGTVGWDGNAQKISLTTATNQVEMFVNQKKLTVNGSNTSMDIAPLVKNSRTFVPVRFSAENLGCKVDWLNSTKEVVIVYTD